MADGSDAKAHGYLAISSKTTWCTLLGLLFGGGATREFAATQVHIDAAPESIWHEVLFYEDVPGKPPLLLALMLSPIGTRGDKSHVGACIECRYKRGSLLKQITAVDMPHWIRFEVTDQCLGIETCAIAMSGSYSIRRAAAGSEIVLTTSYTAFLHPRWLWRRVEKLALHQLHSHVLEGIRKMISAEDRSARIATTGFTCRKEET